METLKLKIKGTSALLMYNGRLNDPLDPYTQRLAHATKGDKQARSTDAGIRAIARAEWEGAMYHDEKLGPFMPSSAVRSAMAKAAGLSKLGAEVKRSTVPLEENCKLEYKGPRTFDELWAAGTFCDRRRCCQNGKGIIRSRPKFTDWSLVFELGYDSTRISRKQLIEIAESSGALIGIGGFRPERGGTFGRYQIEVVK